MKYAKLLDHVKDILLDELPGLLSDGGPQTSEERTAACDAVVLVTLRAMGFQVTAAGDVVADAPTAPREWQEPGPSKFKMRRGGRR